jgi:ferrous iron transport protein B
LTFNFMMSALPRPAPVRRVLLVGNPNVGKSALFSALTGRRALVANYPGTTVEVLRGPLPGRAVEVVDSPGVNSLLPSSEDERVTCELLAQSLAEPGAVVVQVADAKNLRRALLLTLQLARLGAPVVLALNMADEAGARGIRIDEEGLADALGVPVRATVATRGLGVQALVESLEQARAPRNHQPVPDERQVAAYHEALLGHAQGLAQRYASEGRPRTAGQKLGRLAVHPLWGWPILLAVLVALYLVVGVFAAGTLVNLLEDGLFRRVVSPLAVGLASPLPWAFARDLLVGEYGLVTMGLSYGLAIVFPIVTAFFLFFAVLEDSGYLPRLAAMTDRAFRLVGLSGKAVLPMVLGLGCDTMATLTVRILPTRKERVLSTLLLALAIPCSAQLGVILAMVAVVPPAAALVWVGAVLAVFVAVGALGSRLIPGERAAFVAELPPLRVPETANVLAKTAARVEWYLKEALPLFLLGTLLLFGLDRLQLLGAIERAGRPLVQGLLGLPPEASEAFLIGFLRRDFAATHLFRLARGGGLDTSQLVVAMVTITLFIPCVANVFMIARELGARTALAMAGIIFPLAFLAGGAVRVLMRALGPWP